MALDHVLKYGSLYLREEGRWARRPLPAGLFLSFGGKRYAFVDEQAGASLFTRADARKLVKKMGTVRGVPARAVRLVRAKAKQR